MYKPALFCLTAIFIIGGASAQTMSGAADGHGNMSATYEPPDQMKMQPAGLIEFILLHTTSGNDAEPNSTPSEMVMFKKTSWTIMFHGEAFLNELQQTGPRGADKFFSTNWFMPMAQRKIGTNGTLTLRTMLSLEPATVSSERYRSCSSRARPLMDCHCGWPAPARFLYGDRSHV